MLNGIWVGQGQRVSITTPNTRAHDENRTLTFHIEKMRKGHWATSLFAICILISNKHLHTSLCILCFPPLCSPCAENVLVCRISSLTMSLNYFQCSLEVMQRHAQTIRIYVYIYMYRETSLAKYYFLL